MKTPMRSLGMLTMLAMAVVLPVRLGAQAESVKVTLDYVAKKAEERARKPFQAPRLDLPEVLRVDKMDYDKYRQIHFRQDKALWLAEGLPFRIEFFHPGYLYQDPVRIYEFTGPYEQPIRFVRDFFDYGNLNIQDQIPANTGYAGFRVAYPLEGPGKFGEVGTFLGASYFRLLGKGQRYGSSARGLALDCGETNRPEEFPLFTDWWLGKPQANDRQLCLYALLDSVSCAGAYEFVIRPGETTTADIQAILYFREGKDMPGPNAQGKPLTTVGLAPLTSMFWFGENSERKFDDYRPEVHDSDGLLMRLESGEWLWRPLNNAAVLRHQRFGVKNIRGFGLLQRDRDFSHYQDIFNHYHQVPSVWVEPRGGWGEGEVHLVELSTPAESQDNIVAFWDPAARPAPMQPFRFAYRLSWTREADLKLSENKAVATRIGADVGHPGWRQIAIDFAGRKLDAIPENTPPQASAACGEHGAIMESQVFRSPLSGTWRVILKLKPEPDNKSPVDLRCTLKSREEIVSETWTYLWSPP
jgi:periplasmic glucans biosynthesis protein